MSVNLGNMLGDGGEVKKPVVKKEAKKAEKSLSALAKEVEAAPYKDAAEVKPEEDKSSENKISILEADLAQANKTIAKLEEEIERLKEENKSIKKRNEDLAKDIYTKGIDNVEKTLDEQYDILLALAQDDRVEILLNLARNRLAAISESTKEKLDIYISELERENVEGKIIAAKKIHTKK